MTQFRELMRIFWRYLREACGEYDYARYRRRELWRGGLPMTPEAFYISRLRHKYSRPNRCC